MRLENQTYKKDVWGSYMEKEMNFIHKIKKTARKQLILNESF